MVRMNSGLLQPPEPLQCGSGPSVDSRFGSVDFSRSFVHWSLASKELSRSQTQAHLEAGGNSVRLQATASLDLVIPSGRQARARARARMHARLHKRKPSSTQARMHARAQAGTHASVTAQGRLHAGGHRYILIRPHRQEQVYASHHLFQQALRCLHAHLTTRARLLQRQARVNACSQVKSTVSYLKKMAFARRASAPRIWPSRIASDSSC